MTRRDFFIKLEYLLRAIPETEKMDALAYYNDYFDEAGPENEAKVISELGSPEQVAESILSDYRQSKNASSTQQRGDYSEPGAAGRQHTGYDRQHTGYDRQHTVHTRSHPEHSNNGTKILLIILLIFTFPVWFGLVAGIFGTVVGIGGSGIGLFFGGIACMAAGLFGVAVTMIERVVMLGVGALLAALGILFILFVALVAFSWTPKLVKFIGKWVNVLLKEKDGGNEI